MEQQDKQDTGNTDAVNTADAVETYKPLLNNPASKQSPAFSGISLLLFLVAGYFLYSGNVRLLVIITVVLLIHELGHLLAMKGFHYKNLNIFFIPFFGGAATGTKKRVSQKQETIVLLAGPLPGIIIGMLLLLFYRQSSHNVWLAGFASAFLFINMLNLLPVFPLDGGRMLQTMFLGRSFVLSVIFNLLSLVAVVWYSVAGEAYMLLLLAYFLVVSMVTVINHHKIKKLLRAEGFDVQTDYDALTADQYQLLRQRMIQHMPGFGKYDLYEYDVNSKEELNLAKQINLMLGSHPVQDMRIAAKVIILLVWLACFAAPFFTGLNWPF